MSDTKGPGLPEYLWLVLSEDAWAEVERDGQLPPGDYMQQTTLYVNDSQDLYEEVLPVRDSGQTPLFVQVKASALDPDHLMLAQNVVRGLWWPRLVELVTGPQTVEASLEQLHAVGYSAPIPISALKAISEDAMRVWL